MKIENELYNAQRKIRNIRSWIDLFTGHPIKFLKRQLNRFIGKFIVNKLWIK